ncbi:MAG: MATE family efflux transporter [Lachnospiraceae bacterium]|nr:MATE family efflux transporter [Lachnospiraceae bacterium]
MALPTIFSQIIVLIYNMADTFYLGRTNNPYMVAGASLLLPVFNICLSLAGLTGVGGGALISRLLGEGREDEAKKVSAFSFYLSIGITALFSIAMLVFMKPILDLLGASDNTFYYARQYAFCVIVLGGIPTVLSNVLSNLLRSVGVSKEAGLGITMGGVINIVLDPLFMFVLLPKGNEVLGVGIATLISNCLACGYFFCVIYRLRRQSVISFSTRHGWPSRKSIGSILNVGIPSAVTTLLFDIDYVIIDKLMAAYGDIALAAVGIVLKAERLPLNVGIGICQGMMPIVAYNYAAKNQNRMNDTIKFSLKVGVIVSVVSIVLYEIFAGGIMQMFISEPQTVLLGTGFLRIRCLATPLMFMSFFTVYVFQGFGEGNTSLFLGVMRWAVFNIPMLFLLNHVMGMYGIVWSQVSADVLTVLLSFYVYCRYMGKITKQEQVLKSKALGKTI